MKELSAPLSSVVEQAVVDGRPAGWPAMSRRCCGQASCTHGHQLPPQMHAVHGYSGKSDSAIYVAHFPFCLFFF
jgi:hypothetical protein